MKVGTDGRAVLVESSSACGGVIRVRVQRGARQLGRCRARIERGHIVICRAPLRGVWPGGARVVITLRVRGKLVDVVRASLPDKVAITDLQAVHG